MIEAALLALEQSAVAHWVGTTPHVYPLVSSLHILAIGLIVGPIVLVDLRLIGPLRMALSADAAALLVRTALVGFALAVVTGVALFSVQALKYAGNPAMQLKMALLILAGLNALLHRAFSATGPGRARVMPVIGLASLGLWLAIVGAGRWIAFV